MDLNQLSLDAIRDRLVQRARALGITVEEHAAAELHALEAKYGKALVIGLPVAFAIGFVVAKLL